jgi:hypothetical protein
VTAGAGRARDPVRRSLDVERAAGELASALVALRDDSTRNDVRP